MATGATPATKRIAIRGIPLHRGTRVTPDSAIWNRLETRADYLGFARELSGQFAVTAETDNGKVAISDFASSRPIFYAPDASRGEYRVSLELRGVTPLSNGRVNPLALFSYATRAGVGIDPFFDGIRAVFPATVTFFEGSHVESAAYLDWGEYLDEKPASAESAVDRFIEIAAEYLRDALAGESRVACLLSGGTDSALMAWLLHSIGKEVVCLTADYAWKRYSEFGAATEHAAILKLPIERVEIRRDDHREALRALNTELQNAPCCHAQLTSVFALARRARESGITKLVTGDHADSLFLGFERFFRAFPQQSEAYREAVGALSPAQKIAHVYPKPVITPDQRELLSCLGANAEACAAWQQRLHAGDCSQMAAWAERTPLPTLQQLAGQIWAGIGWQNMFLPIAQAFGGEIEFVSPFYDLKMIRFALSLPAELKYRDGVTKPVLRDALSRVIPGAIAKRASPNPSRLWSMAPNGQTRRALSPQLRALYDRLYFRNLARRGSIAAQLEKVSALGLWLDAQRLELS